LNRVRLFQIDVQFSFSFRLRPHRYITGFEDKQWKQSRRRAVACAAKLAGATLAFTFAGPSGFIGLSHLEGTD
jgi:hypothetical protein